VEDLAGQTGSIVAAMQGPDQRQPTAGRVSLRAKHATSGAGIGAQAAANSAQALFFKHDLPRIQARHRQSLAMDGLVRPCLMPLFHTRAGRGATCVATDSIPQLALAQAKPVLTDLTVRAGVLQCT